MSERDAVLLLGASSIVGERLAGLLAREGVRVIGVGRGSSPRTWPAEAGWRHLDLQEGFGDWVLPTASTVVSMLPIWVTAGVAPSLAAKGTRRIVAFSSTSVETKRSSGSKYELQVVSLLGDGERTLRQLGRDIAVTIVRPTLIYGSSRDGNISRIAASLKRLPYFPIVGPAEGLRQPVHCADLAQAAWQILDEPQTAGRTYAVGGAEALTYRAMVSRVGEALGIDVRFVKVPKWMASAGLQGIRSLPRYRKLTPELFARMSQDLVFDNGPAVRDFHFSPRGFDPRSSLKVGC